MPYGTTDGDGREATAAAATSPTDVTSPQATSDRRPIAIFTSALSYGAFANLCPALAGGILGAGGGPIDLLYLWAGPGETISIPPAVRLVRLNVHRSAAAPIALIRYLRRERPRVLVTMPIFVTLPALLAYRLAGQRVRRETRFVVYQGDTLRSDVAIDHSRKSRLRLMPSLAKRWFHWGDGLTACSPGVLALLEQEGVPLPRGRAEVIANPVDVDACRHAAAEPPSHPWITDKTGPVVTTLGRLVKRKNHPMLLRAIADVRRTGLDARLVILGQGPELEATKAQAARLGLAEAVSFPGFLSNPFAEIALSDLFVMSSIDEAFCLALVEAMACGVPVVSTDAIGGGPRFILTGDGGAAAPTPEDADVLRAALVPRDDDAALVAAVCRVLADSDFRTCLAAAGQRRANDFSPAAIGRQWLAFVDSLA
jgi:glycosyltransferase involved in cell wall biosynthesis